MSDQLKDTTRSWLKAFFLLLAGLVAVALLVAAPLSGLWLYLSGELAVDRAVQAQSRGFALFGSTVGRNANATLEYKLDLYKTKRPQIVLAGSAGMGSLKDTMFLGILIKNMS